MSKGGLYFVLEVIEVHYEKQDFLFWKHSLGALK